MAAEINQHLLVAVVTKWRELRRSPEGAANALGLYDRDLLLTDRASDVLVKLGLCTLHVGIKVGWEPPPVTVRLLPDAPRLSDEALVALLLDSTSFS